VTKEPTWLQPKIDQRLALMVENMGVGAILEMARDGVLVTTPLTEPSEGASNTELDYWERSCDNCGRYVAPFTEDKVQFLTGHKQLELHGANVLIFFGACTECAEPV
jgi:hypothetical protein